MPALPPALGAGARDAMPRVLMSAAIRPDFGAASTSVRAPCPSSHTSVHAAVGLRVHGTACRHKQAPARAASAARPPGGALDPETADTREKLKQLLKVATSFPRPDERIEGLLKDLIAIRTPQGGPLTAKLGQGTWEVFSAPHISRLAEPLGTLFSPIRYTLRGEDILSNVRYSSSIFQEGWLSASGRLEVSDAETVQVKFDRFWVDFGVNSLRRELTGTQADAFSDTAVGWLGRLLFFPQFSFFPVLYVDSELAVFSFPPLKSNIAVRKVG